MHNNLQIIYKHNKPYGIRDENGYLFFFTEVAKWSGQEERYRQEVQEQFALADYLLASLQARGLTPLAPDVAHCLCGGEYYTDKVQGVICCRCQAPRR